MAMIIGSCDDKQQSDVQMRDTSAGSHDDEQHLQILVQDTGAGSHDDQAIGVQMQDTSGASYVDELHDHQMQDISNDSIPLLEPSTSPLNRETQSKAQVRANPRVHKGKIRKLLSKSTRVVTRFIRQSMDDRQERPSRKERLAEQVAVELAKAYEDTFDHDPGKDNQQQVNQVITQFSYLRPYHHEPKEDPQQSVVVVHERKREVAKRYAKSIWDGTASVPNNTLTLWSDGSYHGRGKSAGAGVVCKKPGPLKTISFEAFAITGFADPGEAELYAIEAALEGAVFESSQTVVQKLLVLSDCTGAIRHASGKMVPLWRSDNSLRIYNNISTHIRKLRAQGIDIEMHWVPGHDGVTGNVYADRLAGVGSQLARKMVPTGDGGIRVMQVPVTTIESTLKLGNSRTLEPSNGQALQSIDGEALQLSNERALEHKHERITQLNNERITQLINERAMQISNESKSCESTFNIERCRRSLFAVRETISWLTDPNKEDAIVLPDNKPDRGPLGTVYTRTRSKRQQQTEFIELDESEHY